MTANGIGVFRSTIGREPHQFVFARVDAETSEVSERRIQQSQRVGKTDFVGQLDPIAASDTQALGVLEAARLRGLDVPDDLSVIGFDDVEVAQYVGLTTVHQPLYQSGLIGGETLLRNMKDGDDPEHVEMVLQITERTSTGSWRR